MGIVLMKIHHTTARQSSSSSPAISCQNLPKILWDHVRSPLLISNVVFQKWLIWQCFLWDFWDVSMKSFNSSLQNYIIFYLVEICSAESNILCIILWKPFHQWSITIYILHLSSIDSNLKSWLSCRWQGFPSFFANILSQIDEHFKSVACDPQISLVSIAPCFVIQNRG